MSRSSRIRRSLRLASVTDNSLEALLASALQSELANRRGKGAIKTIRLAESTLHETFANPANWEAKGIVQIIYLDEASGEQTTIGTFQELIHRRTAARKFSRVTVDDGSISPLPLIDHDPFLVHGKIDPCPPAPPQSPYERDAIRQYLARTKEQSLDEFLGVSKPDASKLLKQLKDMGVEKLR